MHHVFDSFFRIERHVLCHDNVSELAKICHFFIGNNINPVIDMCDALFTFDHVQSERADFRRFDAVYQCSDIGQLAAGAVDQDNAVFHLLKALVIDNVFRRIHKRQVQGENIRLRKDFVKRYVCRIFFYPVIFIYVICEDLTAKALQVLNYGISDIAGAENADRHALHFTTLQTEQGEVIDLTAPQCLFVIAKTHQHQHDGKVGNAVRRIVNIADTKSDLFCIGKVDMVITDCAGGHIADAVCFPEIQQLLSDTDLAQDGNAFAAFKEFCIIDRRIFCRRDQFNVQLLFPYSEIFLFVTTEIINTDFHSCLLFCIRCIPS